MGGSADAHENPSVPADPAVVPSRSRGASASYTFSGRDFSWISAKGPNEGKAAIYVNGVLKATIDLYSATPLPRRVAYRIHWSTVASHTIRIVNLGTSGRPLIDIDGLALLR